MALTVLDAGILIGVVNGDDAHHAQATAVVTHARSLNQDIVIPASVYAEGMVHPLQAGPEAVAVLDGLIADVPIRIVPLDRDMAREGARFRAEHPSLKFADALVLGTAQVLDAGRVITTDRGWPSVPLEVTVIGT